MLIPKELHPKKDVVLVEPISIGDFISKGGLIIVTTAESEEKLALGKVLAVGKGAISTYTGERLAMDVEVGEYVLHHDRSGWPVTVDGCKLRMVRETDCLCEVEVEESKADGPSGKAPFFKEVK